MARTSKLDNPIRVNYIIEKKLDEKVKEEAKEKGMPQSEIVRRALGNYFNLAQDEREHNIPKDLKDVLAFFEFLKLKIPKTSKKKRFEIKKADLGIMLGDTAWHRMKTILEMGVHIMNMKGIDTFHEDMVLQHEVVGSNRLRQEKYGFKIEVAVPITRATMNRFILDVEGDLKGSGRVKAVNGNGD